MCIRRIFWHPGRGGRVGLSESDRVSDRVGTRAVEAGSGLGSGRDRPLEVGSGFVSG